MIKNNEFYFPILEIEFMSDDKWNKIAIEKNTKRFIEENGYNPKNYDEVKNWIDGMIAKIPAEVKNKPLPMLCINYND